jgi:hypothetical protein
LWTLKLEDLDIFIQKNKDNLDPLQIEGFHTLLMGLDEFFEEESINSIDNHRLQLFSSAILESTDIIRASSDFYGNPSFSNIIVSGKEGNEEIIWYGMICINKIQNCLYNTNLYLIY